MDQKKYHGYLALSRHALLLQEDLGYSLFGFYISLITLARWYRGNPYIGYVIGTQTEIAGKLHIGQSVISRRLQKLEEKKYVAVHARSIKIKYFELFLQDVAQKIFYKNYANLQELYADVQAINAELQGNYAVLQEKRSQNNTQSLSSSFKDNIGSFQDNFPEKVNVDEVIEGIDKQKIAEGNS